MILSVSVPTGRYGTLAAEALKNGVSCDLVDTDNDAGIVYADLHADAYRSIRVSLIAGATRLAVVDKIEHGEPLTSKAIRRTVFR
jgi:hypothetical protein